MDVTRPPKNAPTFVQPHKTTATDGVVQTQTTSTEITKPIKDPASQPTWTPSGSELAKKSPPRSDLPVLDLVGAQSKRGFPDGQKWVAQRLKEIAQLTKLGVPVAVVFDLDNTVFDTRYRTLNALKEFSPALFGDLKIDDVKIDAAATIAHLQKQGRVFSDDVVTGASAHWKQSFWTPANLAHDQPIDDMVKLVKAAQDAGASVKFLTGRTMPFHQASLDQLRAAGIELHDDDVTCKPDVQTQTAPYKEKQMMAWSAKAELGFFVTEGVRDLEHMQSFFKELPLLRLGCSFEEGERLPKIPLWPAAF